MNSLEFAGILAGRALLPEGPAAALENESVAGLPIDDLGRGRTEVVVGCPAAALLAQPGGLLAQQGRLLAQQGGLLAQQGGLLAQPGGMLEDHPYFSNSTSDVGWMFVQDTIFPRGVVSHQLDLGATVVASTLNLDTCRVVVGYRTDAQTPRSRASRTQSALISSIELVERRKGLLLPEQIEGLLRQLVALLIDTEEIAERHVSLVSLDSLITFLSKHRPAVHPNVSLTADGRFAASWLNGRRAKLTLTFDRQGGDWVGVDLDARQRHTGSFMLNSLTGILPPYRSWLNVEGRPDSGFR